MAAPFRIQSPVMTARSAAQPEISAAPPAPSPEPAPSSASTVEFKFYLDRLLKMIPAEVIGLYMVGSGFIPADQSIGLTVWTIVCLIGVVAIRTYGTRDPELNKPPDWTHVIISSIAFVIWVYSLGGPFVAWNLSVPWVGSLLVLAWTFFVPIFYRGPAGG